MGSVEIITIKVKLQRGIPIKVIDKIEMEVGTEVPAMIEVLPKGMEMQIMQLHS